MSTLTTIFSTPPLMVEKYSGDIKTIQEYAESISYHDNQNSYASDNTFVMNDDVFTDLKIFAEECIREYTLNIVKFFKCIQNFNNFFTLLFV